MIAYLLIATNLLIAIAVIPDTVINKMKGGEQDIESAYDFHSNVYYDAYCSTFLLNERDTDIVFLGDSITMGGQWNEFFPLQHVLNRGIGSDVSAGCLARLDEVMSHHPEKIFIMIGCNDLAHNISQEETIYNVEQMLIEVKCKLPECTVYLQSILPSTLDSETVETLNMAYQALSEKHNNCIFVNLWPLFLDEKGRQNSNYYAGDNVHLTGDGYRVWIEAIDDFVTY